jgi:HCOMODA/2-hydroxy-3-carboxy-muconic semialdehyde decarboxylase
MCYFRENYWMPELLDQTRAELNTANRILIQEGVLDAFGHVSARHPTEPDRYLLAAALAPSRIRAGDFLEFDLDSVPIESTDHALYAERFIHGSIYRARADVQAICHHHASAIMPFAVTETPLRPVSQTGAAMGRVRAWDARAEFGDTDLLVSSAEQADSLAQALGDDWLVLMRHHGACVVGRSLRELVFRAVFCCRDAEIQRDAATMGTVSPFSVGERQRAATPYATAVDRCWDFWTDRLEPRNQK